MSDHNAGTGWRQVDLWCDDWRAAEQMAVTYLWPLLAEAEDTESITCWWFVRKGILAAAFPALRWPGRDRNHLRGPDDDGADGTGSDPPVRRGRL
jgi:hypothetical protein